MKFGKQVRAVSHWDDVLYVASKHAGVAAINPADNSIVWQHETNDWRYLSPTLVDETVVTGSGRSIYGLDVDSGALQWKADDLAGLSGESVAAAPAIADGTVYVVSDDGTVYALDAQTGTLEWERSPKFELTGHKSSPAVMDETVFIGATTGMFDSNGTVYALDTDDGSVLWERDTEDRVDSSPTVVDGIVYVGSDDQCVYALDAETGEIRWKQETADWVKTAPAVVEEHVFVGSRDGHVYALDSTDGSVRWRYDAGERIYLAPTVVDGSVYVATDFANVHALDAKTGLHEWTLEVGGSEPEAHVTFYAPPIVANGRLFLGTNYGTVIAYGES